MSLNIWLEAQDGTDLFTWNITHTLNTMASEAGIYEEMWRPDEIGITTARQLVAPLSQGLAALVSDPARFEKFNPNNGWGNYEGLVKCVMNYCIAAARHPEAKVRVSR